MTDRDPLLEPFEALIGTWATEASHPLVEETVPGTVTFEWLEGARFLLQRSHNDHELFPDAICVIGAPEAGEGLVMEYFDSRGVRRTYGVSLEDGVLAIWRDHEGFDQRFSARLGPEAFEGRWQLAKTRGEWRDDLEVRYRRLLPASSPHLFAGVRVKDLQGVRKAVYRDLDGNELGFGGPPRSSPQG